MATSLEISAGTVLGFALVLSRIAGVFVFAPFPSQDAGPAPARIALAFATTLILFPQWPQVAPSNFTLGTMALWMISEVALGVAIGLAISFIAEALIFGAQTLGLQAGYGYASVIDPTTNADSNVLPVLAQLTGGMLFFSAGMHRYAIAAFAHSLETFPPGAFTIPRSFADTVLHLGSNIFSVGLRIALPIVGLLLMTDIAMALLGRMNTQLQLSVHAFPAKMLITLFMLVLLLVTAPSLYSAFAASVFQQLHLLRK